MNIEYDFPMTSSINNTLKKIVEDAKRGNVCIGHYFVLSDGTHSFLVDKSAIDSSNWAFDVFVSLELIIPLADKKSEDGIIPFIIQEKAIKWVNFYKKPKPIRWFIKQFDEVKNIIIGVSFLLSVTLTILQIVQYSK